MKKLQIFKHDDEQGGWAVYCHQDSGPIFGIGDILIADKWNCETLFVVFESKKLGVFLFLQKKTNNEIFFFPCFCFTCRSSTQNYANFPTNYHSKRMRKDFSSKRILAGSFKFQVDDLEVFHSC